MKVLVIGATGTIGAAVVDALREDGHDVVGASRSGDVSIDIEDRTTVEAAIDSHGPFDAIVCAAGTGAFGAIQDLSDEAWDATLNSKLMGQVGVVRASHDKVGTVVLTSGILAQHPWPGSSALAMANGALESFVRAAALDLGTRAVVVSPPLVRETAVAMGMDAQGPTAAEVARRYVAALSAESGSVLHVD